MSALARMAKRVREKNLHTWLPGYARALYHRATSPTWGGPKHLLFALCDHFEPLWADPPDHVARERVQRWVSDYPLLAGDFRDSTGRVPRHSFFFPGEQNRAEFLEPLAELARAGYGEVELHLHHDGDTPASLSADIERYKKELADFGHLARDRNDTPRFAFIHGNWCLANARRDGRYCGVDSEVALLWDLGCYADFTFPAAPNESQSRVVNQIYWPAGDLSRRRAYDAGERASVGQPRNDRILFIEGPLALARRPGKLSVRIENGDLHGGDAPTPQRIRTWVEQSICVDGRPDWVFVKVHTHGAPEKNAPSLLGDGGRVLHEELTTRYNSGEWNLHYVTAREMFNIAMAAMHGESGNPSDYRDYVLPPPPAAVS